MELWVTVAAATAALPSHFSPSASQPSFGQGARGLCYAYIMAPMVVIIILAASAFAWVIMQLHVGWGGFAKQRPTFTPARKNNLPQSVRFGKPVVHSPKPALDAQVKSGNSAQHAFRTSNTN